MHVPDGFLDATTSIATGAIAAGAVGISLHRSEREIREAGAPLAGLTAAFVFAAQMVNFPVGAGTSGHLLGGALAAALVGPFTGVLCMTVVLVVQAVLFADGGLTALGTNITLMGVVTVVVGYLVARGLLTVLPRRVGSVVPAAAVGALLSVPVAALAFTGLYAVGGAVDIPIGALAAAMVGWHVLIGAGEAVVTGAVLTAVVATRPDLVYLARHLRPELVLTEPGGGTSTVRPDVVATARPTRRPLGAALAVCLVVAGGVSLAASAHPDGLNFVGEQLGFADVEQGSAVAGGPLAGYALAGLDNPWMATALAGIIGVLVTVGVGAAAARVAGRRRGSAQEAGASPRRGRA